jgi:hypothetical protein
VTQGEVGIKGFCKRVKGGEGDNTQRFDLYWREIGDTMIDVIPGDVGMRGIG